VFEGAADDEHYDTGKATDDALPWDEKSAA
jgi:hypothetical protein